MGDLGGELGRHPAMVAFAEAAGTGRLSLGGPSAMHREKSDTSDTSDEGASSATGLRIELAASPPEPPIADRDNMMLVSMNTHLVSLAAISPDAVALVHLLGLLPAGMLSSDLEAIFGDGFQFAEAAAVFLFPPRALEAHADSPAASPPHSTAGGRKGEATPLAAAQRAQSVASYDSRGIGLSAGIDEDPVNIRESGNRDGLLPGS